MLRAYLKPVFLLVLSLALLYSCEHVKYSTVPIPDDSLNTAEPDPNFDVTLNYYFQDYTSFIFLGNRAEAFGTYFNKFFTANEDYEEALKEFKATAIAFYNRKLDSLNVLPPVQQGTKDKFTKVIERCSKIIQYNKSTKYFDRAMVLIGKSYFYSQDYIQSERKFTEFLSRLSKSEQADEALLFLGLTKFRMRKYAEGEIILKNLLSRNVDTEIKSQAYLELAATALLQSRMNDVENYLRQSIELTNDKELKAEREFLLAKMLIRNNKPDQAPAMYEQAFRTTSDFDLEFYSRLNEAKSYILIRNFPKAGEVLEYLTKKYLDYPEMLQLVELEQGNLDYSKKQYADARQKYFDIIVKYPGSKATAEAYYNLGTYYEFVKADYLKALVSYKKAIETNSQIDYATLCTKKTQVLDRYFTLQADIHDTVKVSIPNEEHELELYKQRYDEEKNKNIRKENPNKELGNPKGGGYLFRDSIPDTEDSLMNAFQKVLQQKKQQEENKGNEQGKDTIKPDLNEQLQGRDTLKGNENPPVVNEDSIRKSKENLKIGAYFELSEIFFYDLERPDSSVYYLNKILTGYSDPVWLSRATFYLASIYKSTGDETKAKEYYADVIQKYPNSIFANESRKILNIPVVEQVHDAADSLLNQAQKSIISGDNGNVLPLLYEACNYPLSSYYPKTLFSLAWMYENIFPDKDSVYKYCSMLLSEFPQSEYSGYAADKKAFLDALNAKDSAVNVSGKETKRDTDSLKTQNDTLNAGRDTLNGKQQEEINQQGEEVPKQEIKREEENPVIKGTEEQNGEQKQEGNNEGVTPKKQ